MRNLSFRVALFVTLIVFLPAFAFFGFVPTGALLIWTVRSHTLPDVLLSMLALTVTASITWVAGRMLQKVEKPWRVLVVALLLFLPIAVGTLTIYGTSPHGPIPYKTAYETYVQQYRGGSL